MPLVKPTAKITREFSITKAPKIFCLHLNRLADFDPYGNICKNNKFIKFPQILNLGNIFGSQNTHVYQLKSVVEHYGGANSGHYVTMRKVNWTTVEETGKLIRLL